MMATDTLGLYVHIPFCVKKCNYCDFCSVKVDDELKERYVDALIKEIESKDPSDECCNSIFFGGGTPSLLSSTQFSRICDSLRRKYKMDRELEFTVEVNPGTVSRDNLKTYIENGVNRISLGMQSSSDAELKILGRIHTYDEFCDSYSLIRSVGFDNVNIDIMYGLPSQSTDSFAKTLSEVTSMSPEHISCYGLIIEEDTPFGRNRGSLDLPPEDDECEMYYNACAKLASCGYNHYEISNFAKPGYESVHNLKYWNYEPYLGFGVAAHSKYYNNRKSNTCDIHKYIEAEFVPDNVSVISKEDMNTEYIMLKMRLASGLSFAEYKKIFGHDFDRDKINYLKQLSEIGFVNLSGDGVSFTEKGFYVSNSILCELI